MNLGTVKWTQRDIERRNMAAGSEPVHCLRYLFIS